MDDYHDFDEDDGAEEWWSRELPLDLIQDAEWLWNNGDLRYLYIKLKVCIVSW